MATDQNEARLRFMIMHGRGIVSEGIGTNGRGVFYYKVYVCEGIFTDQVGEVHHFEGDHDWKPTFEQTCEIIDAAMKFSEQSSEKSN